MMRDPSASGGRFDRPTSVLITGANRTLLKWVAYALAMQHHAPYFWTDLQMHDEDLGPLDPIAQKRVPADQLSIVHPYELSRNDDSARVVDSAVGGVIRADEPSENVQRVAGFLRLPTHTQEVLARMPSGGPPPMVILSNGHRIVALYPRGTVGPVIRAIVDYGVILIVTFADAVGPEGGVFETILSVEGDDPARWREAILRVQKGSANGPFVGGSEVPLGSIPWIASLIEPARRE